MPLVVAVKLALLLLLGLVIAAVLGPDCHVQKYEAIFRPVPATALPESVTTVPAVTFVGMLPKVTTGLGTVSGDVTTITAVAVPVCDPLSVADNMKVYVPGIVAVKLAFVLLPGLLIATVAGPDI